METIVTITGPSLSGKTTLGRMLVQSGDFTEMVSHTTRKKRAGEENHRDYHFVGQGAFMDTAMVESVEFSGCRYGLALSTVEAAFESGKIPLVVVEPLGAQQIANYAAKMDWKHVSVFVDVSVETLLLRFLTRFLQQEREDFGIEARRLTSLVTEELHWHRKMDWRVIVPGANGHSLNMVREAVALPRITAGAATEIELRILDA